MAQKKPREKPFRVLPGGLKNKSEKTPLIHPVEGCRIAAETTNQLLPGNRPPKGELTSRKKNKQPRSGTLVMMALWPP